MKCPECQASGQTSRVYDRGSTRTLLGGGGQFWDGDGARHFHEVNTTTSYFECTNKHSWAAKSKPPCPVDDCSYNEPVAAAGLGQP